MPIYDNGRDEQRDCVQRMIDKYHGDLRDAQVKVDVLRAWAKLDKNGDPVGPALTLHGYPCLAIVRVIPYKQRVKGSGDAEIVIDDERWDELSSEEQEALIDHELEHLVLRHKEDDLGRPKLKLRHHDYRLEGFDAIIRRHGQAALEWQYYSELAIGAESRVRQLWLPYVQAEASVGPTRGKDAAVVRA